MVDEAERALRRALARLEFEHFRTYVAVMNGQLAAHAAMFVSSPTRTAVLAATATLPEWQRLGCQTALIARRARDAAAAGCDLLAVEPTPGSQSQRNLERLGFRLLCTGAIWRR